MNREPVSSPLANVLFEGADPDGIVREGAFRARVSLSSAANPSGATGSPAKYVAAFFSADLADLKTRIAAVRRADAQVPIYVVATSPDSVSSLAPDEVRDLINSHRVRRWLRREVATLENAMTESLRERDARNDTLKSRRELGTRNRQLHDLQENLEKIVNERTSYLSDAERELHRRTQAMRELVRFIKDLSQTETIEELMMALNQEIRSFHEVRAPILAVVSPEFGARLHFQQTRAAAGGKTGRAQEKGWGSKPTSRLWTHRSAIRVGAVEDQAYLAQELGRPVARTISIPLGRDQRANEGRETRSPAPLLIFEHSFDEAKTERFKSFLLPRIEPLSTALDRIIINREMHAASRLWETTFDGIADPVAVISTDYEVLRMNEAFERFPGGAKRRCFEAFANRSQPCDGCRLPEVVAEGRPYDWQVRRARDVYEVNGYPIRLAKSLDESPATVHSVIHHYGDVTKSLELKGRAFQGEKMAAIGLMAGNIAHELNNPLAGLRSLAQVLSVEPGYPASVREDMKQIENAAERSSAIIRDLMEFSKADDRVREKISLNEIADRSLNMIKTALHEHSVNTDWADATDVMVEVDPHLLQHVLFNIVNNACQAMREPGEVSMLTRAAAKHNRRWVEIEISDTGPGIPPEIRDRIFEPFFTTKAAGQGTGLGLSMSRWIVENSGGVIEVRDRPNQLGTTFIVRLPQAQG